MKALELLPPSETMYRALVDRDSSFEGIFFVGVRTTGIFCRPTCTGQKPARENVDFFGRRVRHCTAAIVPVCAAIRWI
jgi:AraC family transcriptional regulator of adaptative response/methylated-DNA-[protein]-cysteine methyltransferase